MLSQHHSLLSGKERDSLALTPRQLGGFVSACVCLKVALGACVSLCVFDCARVSVCVYCTISV